MSPCAMGTWTLPSANKVEKNNNSSWVEAYGSVVVTVGVFVLHTLLESNDDFLNDDNSWGKLLLFPFWREDYKAEAVTENLTQDLI